MLGSIWDLTEVVSCQDDLHPVTDTDRCVYWKPGRIGMQTQLNLTPKQESFALLVAEVDPSGNRVRNLSDSYRQAYSAEAMTAKSINEAASRLRHDRKIATRIEALSAENEALRRENAAYTLERGAEWIIAKLWELAEDTEISSSARIRSLYLLGKDAGMFGPECRACAERDRVPPLTEEECLTELEARLREVLQRNPE